METIIRKAGRLDYPIIIEIWERSVRATHRFLLEKDLQDIRQLMATHYLPNVDLYVATDCERILGFIGIAAQSIEMLFVDSDCLGKGIGSKLISYAFSKGVLTVDVNEQNYSALEFYISKGFHVTSRDEVDSDGRPYPILHLSL